LLPLAVRMGIHSVGGTAVPVRRHADGRQREVMVGNSGPDAARQVSHGRIESPRRLVIATRESALALWQANRVRDALRERDPALEVDLLGLTTEGDGKLDQPLAEIGGKGLFIKELEAALADGRADIAVHSLKDVPMDLPDGFTLAAITAREDPR